MSNALKAIARNDSELRVANYIVLFGGRDLEGVVPGTPEIYRTNPDGTHGEFFTSTTDFESPFTKAGGFAVDFQHGEGREMFGAGPGADDILGFVDWKTAKKDERGIFVERVLDLHNVYVKWVADLIELGIMGTSTQATKGVQKADTGEITRWPLWRDTISVVPMEPRMKAEFGDNAIRAFKALGIPVPDDTAETETTEETEPEADQSAASVSAQYRVKAERFRINLLKEK